MNYDKNFLALMDTVKVKRQFIKIILLSFNEEEIREIRGVITSGNISVNGSSAVRRTINLSMFADKNTNNLTNLDNLISLNKKIKVEVGFHNPLVNYQEKYGEEIWFKQGVFIISNASVNATATGCAISIQGKDKMGALDGTVGGTLPASVTFHETYVKDYYTGDITVEYPTIYQIIEEAVNHYGNEPLHKIIINDLSHEIKLLLKYVRKEGPIYFVEGLHTDFKPYSDDSYNIPCQPGTDVGYMMTDFTYPGDLILGAGSTVTTLLDNIIKVLPNYEYFYDVDGNFVFQEKQNYMHHYYTPLVPARHSDSSLQSKDYIRSFNNSKYIQNFTDGEGITTFNNNPKYDNIKNDFVVWGQRTGSNGVTREIRYHLAIDEKPSCNLAGYYMWEIRSKEDNHLIRYEYTTTDTKPSIDTTSEIVIMIGKAEDPTSYEWREELYRQSLELWLHTGDQGPYGAELTAVYDEDENVSEWRKLYNPMRDDWEDTGGWNPDVTQNPEVLDYWLDFIDSPTLGEYSVKRIGRRTKVVNDTSLKSIYNKEVPDVVFIKSPQDIEEQRNIIERYNNIGQDICFFQPNEEHWFAASNTPSSCYEKIRELLDIHLIYNITITINCLPKYYLEPNHLIYVQDNNSGIQGSFVISNFSLPLQYNGMMSITATQAITRV